MNFDTLADQYPVLNDLMGIPEKQSHIGMFDVWQCQQVVRICTNERS